MPLEDLYFSFGIPGVRAMEILGFSGAGEGSAGLDPELFSLCGASWHAPVPWNAGDSGTPSGKGSFPGDYHLEASEEYDEHFEKQGLLELFPCVVTASDTPKGKPYPIPMLEYLRRTGAAPEEVLYFGDTAYDMDCARSAGGRSRPGALGLPLAGGD